MAEQTVFEDSQHAQLPVFAWYLSGVSHQFSFSTVFIHHGLHHCFSGYKSVLSIHQLFVLASHRPQPAQIHTDYFVLWGLTILCRRHFGHLWPLKLRKSQCQVTPQDQPTSTCFGEQRDDPGYQRIHHRAEITTPYGHRCGR